MCIYIAGMCAYLSFEGDVINYCVLMDCQGQCSIGDFPPCRACNIGVCSRSSAPCDNNEHRRWRTAHGGCGWHLTCPFRRTSGPGSFLGASTRGVAFGAQPVLLSDGAFGSQPVFLNDRVFNAGARASFAGRSVQAIGAGCVRRALGTSICFAGRYFCSA